MRITAIRATLLKERILWAREVETIVTLRSLQPQDSPALHSKRIPWLGSTQVKSGMGLGRD